MNARHLAIPLEEARGRRVYLGKSDTKTHAGLDTSPEPQYNGESVTKTNDRFDPVGVRQAFHSKSVVSYPCGASSAGVQQNEKFIY